MPVKVRGHDVLLPYDDGVWTTHQTLASGQPLVGSTTADGAQLATKRVLVRDLQGGVGVEDLPTSLSLANPGGEFIADAPPGLTGQRVYHLYQNFYETADRYLTAPGDPSIKQWDSFLGIHSTFPPGTFEPRVVVFINTKAACQSQPACVSRFQPGEEDIEAVPEVGQFFGAFDVKYVEALAYTHFRSDNIGPKTIAHEFGHVLDNFLFSGTAAATSCMTDVDCELRCQEDTPDEAPPLTEAVAHLLALLLWYDVSPTIAEDDCEAVRWVSNGIFAGTPGPCQTEGGGIAYSRRAEDCPGLGLDATFCDKPQLPGQTEVCCSDNDPDPACTVVSLQCASGTARWTPSGRCSKDIGYRSNSTLQAYWQLLIGKVCAPEPPFTCVPIPLPADVTPTEAAARALFFALRANSRTYRQLFDHIADYYACEYGAAAYEGVRAALCNHQILECDAPLPLLCGECGNAILDPGESCDRTEIATTCEAMGYAGGTLACSLTCELITDGCIEATDTLPTPEPTTAPLPSPEPGGLEDPQGCLCNPTGRPTPTASLALLGLCAMMLRRRRRR